jgi:hypothetical protein
VLSVALTTETEKGADGVVHPMRLATALVTDYRWAAVCGVVNSVTSLAPWVRTFDFVVVPFATPTALGFLAQAIHRLTQNDQGIDTSQPGSYRSIWPCASRSILAAASIYTCIS